MIALILALSLTSSPAPLNAIRVSDVQAVKTSAASQDLMPSKTEVTLSGVSVRLECIAFADGHVGGCRVLQETHPGLHFGEAAVALMQGSTLDPSDSDARFERTIQFTP